LKESRTITVIYASGATQTVVWEFYWIKGVYKMAVSQNTQQNCLWAIHKFGLQNSLQNFGKCWKTCWND